MNAAAPAAPAPRWWLAAGSLLLAGYAIVLVALVAWHAGGEWSGGPPAIVVPGSALELVRGGGRAAGNTFVLDAPDATGTAIVAARVAPLPAARHARVEWKLATPGAGEPALTFVWRTRDQPARTLTKAMRWVDGSIAPLALDPADGWTGTVTGFGLAVRGALPAPLVLESVTLPAVSAATAVETIRGQWTARYPFKASSIAFPFDEERNDHLSLLAATALAQVLAIAGYLLLARRLGWTFDARVLWAVFLGGWLLLDARWQVGLWRQLGDTARAYAGKSTDEKHRAAVDREYYALMREMGAALPAAPTRVFFLSDNPSLRARGAFFLYPHNVNAFLLEPGQASRPVPPEALRPGDHLLLLLYSGARYERGAGALVWADGRRRAVAEVLWKDEGIVLLRVE